MSHSSTPQLVQKRTLSSPEGHTSPPETLDLDMPPPWPPEKYKRALDCEYPSCIKRYASNAFSLQMTSQHLLPRR